MHQQIRRHSSGNHPHWIEKGGRKFFFKWGQLDLWDNIKNTNIHSTVVPGEERGRTIFWAFLPLLFLLPQQPSSLLSSSKASHPSGSSSLNQQSPKFITNPSTKKIKTCMLTTVTDENTKRITKKQVNQCSQQLYSQSLKTGGHQMSCNRRLCQEPRHIQPVEYDSAMGGTAVDSHNTDDLKVHFAKVKEATQRLQITCLHFYDIMTKAKLWDRKEISSCQGLGEGLTTNDCTRRILE